MGLQKSTLPWKGQTSRFQRIDSATENIDIL